MAYKFYEIKIGTIFLTESGDAPNAENLLCKLNLQGANRLRSNYKRIRLPDAIDGTPIFQTIEVGSKGKPLVINVGMLFKSVLDDIIELIEGINENGGVINIEGTGATGDFDLNFVPGEEPYQFGEFRGTRVKNVILSFVSV